MSAEIIFGVEFSQESADPWMEATERARLRERSRFQAWEDMLERQKKINDAHDKVIDIGSDEYHFSAPGKE